MSKRIVFTDAEREVVYAAAGTVWQQIGYDCIAPMGEDNEEYPVREMRRSEVIEVVSDADRLEQAIRAEGKVATRRAMAAGTEIPSLDYDGLAAKVQNLDMAQITRLLKPAFPHSRYGL